MLCIPPFMQSNFCPNGIFTSVTKTVHLSPCVNFGGPYLSPHCKNYPPMCLSHSTLISAEREELHVEKEKPVIKWRKVGPDITEAQKQAISVLPPKMTNRCKALMKRIICFSPEDENVSHLLAAWVKVMKPRRADWLTVLKEIKRLDSPLFFEVMELALMEDSFEANVRDYTKLIDTYAKNNCVQSAENTLEVMKSRGFPCDQVTLTVLINMYSRSGDLDRAKQVFQDIQLLGLPLDKRAYGSMIMAYIRAGMLGPAETLLKEMEAREIFAGREVYKALLRAYSTAGNADGAQRVFDAIQFARIVPDSKICALLINAYIAGGHRDKALSVLENMKSAGLEPGDKCVALMLAAYEEEERLDEALALLKKLVDDGVAIAEEAGDVLERWFQRLGVVDDELQRELRNLSQEKKVNVEPPQASRGIRNVKSHKGVRHKMPSSWLKGKPKPMHENRWVKTEKIRT